MANETELVRELRDKTGSGILDCRKALQESAWDLSKAVDFLRKRGAQIADKKSGRATNAGKVESYIHMGGKIGVLVEINCETDFVARTEQFQEFTKDVAMHIAAAAPQYLRREEVPQAAIDREKAVAAETLKGKPESVVEKIMSGKMDKYYQQICLLEQLFVKDDKKTIQAYLTEIIAKTGENVVIKRYTRFALGE